MIELLRRRWYRIFQTRLPEAEPLRPISLKEEDPTSKSVLETRPLLEKILRENILPFWLEKTVDRDHGGFLLNHDSNGSWMGPNDKACIPQSRMVWFFSRVFRAAQCPDCLAVAEQGVRFLRESLWDEDRGGFFWSVSHDGDSVMDSSKRLYAQSFALFALSEYARASQDPEGVSFAREMAQALRSHFYDREFGGYLSELDSDMKPAGTQGPRRGTVRHKTVNEHLHVLEALNAYSHLGGEPWVMPALQELILILTGTTLRKTMGTNSDRHLADWTPVLAKGQAAVSYGHDLESTWLVAKSCSLTGLPFALVADWARSLLDHTLRWGWDRKEGGVYLSGPLGGPAHSRQKVWWVQAEALVGSLTAYRLIGDPRYAEFYLSTLDWVVSRHVDWKGGEWRATIEEDGAVTGDRAEIWKSPYHNGRAMIECIELLPPGNVKE